MMSAELASFFTRVADDDSPSTWYGSESHAQTLVRSQRREHWRLDDTCRGLPRLRPVQSDHVIGT